MIEAISSVDELIVYLANTPDEKLLYHLWEAESIPDLRDSEKHIIGIIWDSLLLEDSAEYRELSELGRQIKTVKTDLAKKLLIRLGYTKDDAEKKIENTFSFETMLADLIPSNEVKGNPDYTSGIYKSNLCYRG